MRAIVTYLIGIIITFFAPAAVTFLVITFFVILDLISGIYASWYNGEEITSKKMRNSVGKLIAYYILIMLFHTFDVIMIAEFFGRPYLFPFVAFFLGSIEVKSVCENISKVLGQDIWSAIKEWLAQNKKSN